MGKWIKIKDQMPPHEVVLVACDTYDCGWTIDTARWNEDDKCWMSTGCIKSHKTYLPYTHWRELPKPPKRNN